MKTAVQGQASIAHVSAAGGIAGGIADAVLHSVDTIKTRMQGQLTTSTTSRYISFSQTLLLILREEGLRGVYGGLTSGVVGSLLTTTAYFGIYETWKRKLVNSGNNPTLSFFAAGCVAEVFAAFIYVPSEVVKTRLQLQGRYNNPHSLSAHNYRGTLNAFSDIYKKRGVSGLYRGYGATLLRDVPFSALQFSIYENIKSYFVNEHCEGDVYKLTAQHDMVAGAVSGSIAGILTTPLDVVKTFLQTQTPVPRTAVFLELDAVENKGKAIHYSGIKSAFVGIYKQRGLSALFSGVSVRCVWTGSQSMIMFLCYEFFLQRIKHI